MFSMYAIKYVPISIVAHYGAVKKHATTYVFYRPLYFVSIGTTINSYIYPRKELSVSHKVKYPTIDVKLVQQKGT